MAGYFLDTSAIVKRYVQEIGTSWVRGLTGQGNRDEIDLARITLVELTSAVARRRRGGTLAESRASSILSRFRRQIAGRYLVVEIPPGPLADAANLANTHELRAYDAVQLAAAIDVNKRWKAGGLGGITLVTADRELFKAAIAENIMADDPNLHP